MPTADPPGQTQKEAYELPLWSDWKACLAPTGSQEVRSSYRDPPREERLSVAHGGLTAVLGPHDAAVGGNQGALAVWSLSSWQRKTELEM